MKLLNTLSGLLAVLLFTGCATTDEIVLDSTKRPATTSVVVFKEDKVPDRKFKEIAELSFLGAREDEIRAEKRFIEQAKRMGGNAVIFTMSNGTIKGGGTVFQSVAYVFRGKVIVYE